MCFTTKLYSAFPVDSSRMSTVAHSGVGPTITIHPEGQEFIISTSNHVKYQKVVANMVSKHEMCAANWKQIISYRDTEQLKDVGTELQNLGLALSGLKEATKRKMNVLGERQTAGNLGNQTGSEQVVVIDRTCYDNLVRDIHVYRDRIKSILKLAPPYVSARQSVKTFMCNFDNLGPKLKELNILAASDFERAQRSEACKDKKSMKEQTSTQAEHSMHQSDGQVPTKTEPKPSQETQNKSAHSDHVSHIRKTEDTTSELKKQLAVALEDIAKLQADKDELQRRLSDKLVQGVQKDSAFEDVTKMSRPLLLREKYEHICSDEWLAVKDLLDRRLSQSGTEQMKCWILCLLFGIAVRDAAKKRNEALVNVGKYMECILVDKVPGAQTRHGHHGKPTENTSTDQDYQRLVTDYLLAKIQKTNLDSLTQAVTKDWYEASRKRMPSYSYIPEDQNTIAEWMHGWVSGQKPKPGPVKAFIEAVCKLAWAMVLQRVPLRFSMEGDDKPFDPKSQKLYHNSSADEKAEVMYYVYPTMLQRDMVVSPATVVLKPSQYLPRK